MDRKCLPGLGPGENIALCVFWLWGLATAASGAEDQCGGVDGDVSRIQYFRAAEVEGVVSSSHGARQVDSKALSVSPGPTQPQMVRVTF